jgi:hypothetical protein
MHMCPKIPAFASPSPISDECLALSGLVRFLAQTLANKLGAITVMPLRVTCEENLIRRDTPVRALLFVLSPTDVKLFNLRQNLVGHRHSNADN